MELIQEYLHKIQSNQNICEKEDLISVLVFIAQQQLVEQPNDSELISKLVFYLLSNLHKDHQDEHILHILLNLKNHNYFTFENSSKIFIKDKFAFKLYLLVSLKYRRNFNANNVNFWSTILKEIIETIDILKPQSIHLIRLLEILLKKRDDALTSQLADSIISCMNKVAYSPLPGFKNWSHNVSRIILKSVLQQNKDCFCNFNNLPIKGIDLNDILNFCDKNLVKTHLKLVNEQILRLFSNNTDSREASFLYDRVISFYNFEEFVETVWPFYSIYFEDFNEGEFYQSFLKYFIPITVKKYQHNFYSLIKQNDKSDFYLQAYTLLEVRKKGFFDKAKFDKDVFGFVKFVKTCDIGLKIITTFNKKFQMPESFEIEVVKFYLVNYSKFDFSDDAVKSLKQFVSQIFLVSHITLGKENVDLTLYLNFLKFLADFCVMRFHDCRIDCEVSAQVLKIIWDVASGPSTNLSSCYRIDRENCYESGGNLFYQKLIRSTLWKDIVLNPMLLSAIKNLICVNFKHCPKLIQVVKEHYLEHVDLSFLDLLKFLLDVSLRICLESSEKVRSYTDLYIASKKKQNHNIFDDILNLLQTLDKNIGICDSKNMFTCVLVFDSLIINLTYDDINLVNAIQKSLTFFEQIFRGHINMELNAKEVKVLESFINNVIESLTKSQHYWHQFDNELLLSQLCAIIELSNMKRPVSLSANFVNYFGVHNEDNLIKIKLLSRTLNSLHREKESGKIRRNPETRLVIHALCQSDKNLSKPLLVWSLNFMLEVLSNPLSSNRTLSSTLHSLEVLVSDKSLHSFTLGYIVEIIKNSVRLFNKNSWIVRNADLQLLKSLIERFLGVSLSENVRPKTVEDLFLLYPTLIDYFHEILSSELNDSALIVLLFFAESQIKSDVLTKSILEDHFHNFRILLAEIIKTHSNNVGFLAIEAFTALCMYSEIPKIVSEVVYYIQENFVHLAKNIFANLVKLLRELYYKYESSLVKTHEISGTLDALITYLKQFDCFYFNLLYLRVLTFDEIKNKVVSLQNNDYERRILLNNYIPFVIVEVGDDKLAELLKEVYSIELPEFLQARILSVLVDKITNSFPFHKVGKILIENLISLPDSSTFLITAYSKIILLLYEWSPNLNFDFLITNIRKDYKTKSVYKIFVYILVLAQITKYDDDDCEFIKKCIQMYIKFVEDDQVITDIACTLIHLYKCVHYSERHNILRLSFYLLLNEKTSFEICKFISWLTNSHSSSILVNLVNLLKFSNLSNLVGTKMALNLLLDFYCYINDLPDELEESDTYYLIESDSPVIKQYVKSIVRKNLSAFKICNDCSKIIL